MVMAAVADTIFKNNIEDISADTIERNVMAILKDKDYGVKFEYFRVTNFAVIKALRLIQDQNWISEGLSMNTKK